MASADEIARAVYDAAHPDPYASFGLRKGFDPVSHGAALETYFPSLGERVGNWAQDLMTRFGASPGYAQGFGVGARNVAGMLPGVGQAISAYDTGREGAAGNYGMASLAALGAIPGAGKAAEAVEEEAPRIIAYHGSPHSFDKFDMSKIGTGEGAQAYGHGLYFAGNEDVARSYRDALTKTNPTTTEDGWAAHVMAIAGGDREKAARIAQSNSRDAVTDEASAQWKNVAKRISSGEDIRPGHMYEVAINAHPDHFLDWDKPLSEQHPKVQEAVKKIAPDAYKLPSPAMTDSEFSSRYGKLLAGTPYENMPRNMLGGILSAGPEGAADFINLVRTSHPEAADKLSAAVAGYNSPKAEDVYHHISSLSDPDYVRSASLAGLRRAYSGGADASEALKAAGVPGIKYLDAGSRGAGDGSRNYVVFNDSIIDILRKYGLAGLLAGGGASTALSSGAFDPPQPDQF